MPQYTRKKSKNNRHSVQLLKHVIKHNYKYGTAYQYGGNEKIYEEKIDSCTIRIREQTDPFDKQIITIYGGSEKRPCFILFHDKSAQNILVQELSRNDNQLCMSCKDTKNYENLAEKMMKIIMYISQKKRVKTVVFSDDSSKKCHAANKPFQLMNMYFLAYGKTWYESKMPTMQSETDLTFYRERVHKNKWIAIVEELNMQNTYDSFLDSLTSSIPDSIDPTQEGSAMAVFRWLKETNQCVPFCNYMDAFIIGSKIKSLFGTNWTVHL